ncbi:MAG TPA: DUF4838 domain-containing protein [Pirellulaceae bacterium]|nr:DUF4838 domain-containing protein [Pirellulaceae bacterium]
MPRTYASLALFTLLMATYCTNAQAIEPAAPNFAVASQGKAFASITLGANASEATKASAAELAEYLQKITGSEFKTETGDGSRGIVVGKATDFSSLPFPLKFADGAFEREAYLLRSTKSGLYLLGATDLAVSHAVWDLLHRAGYRQFFPGETWEIIPHVTELSFAIDAHEAPAFHARRIWYNWGLWGYNDQPYHQWCVRNRAVKGFDLNSGHAYEGIIAANRAEFDQHPEYYAQVAGERKLRPDVKFCISNPGLRKLVVDHAVRTFQANPKLDSISMDPSDGGGWCECDACNQLGSVSNRVVTLANEVAVGINAQGWGEKYVGMYAYNKHSAPPTIKVDKHVIPSATTAFIGGGFTFEQVVNGWQAQGATMGVYDYLSVVDWDWNLPRGGSGARPENLATFLPRIHQQGVRFYDAESGDCWGPCGLGYYFASRVLWDVKQGAQLDAITDDFLTKCFGAAKAPMAEFYQLINRDQQRRSPSDLVGRMYRHLATAQQATKDAKVLARIDDLILYTRHAELYYAFANSGGSKDDVARHAYRMRKTMMVHSYGLWSRLISQQAALTPEHPLKSEAPFSRAELDALVRAGIEKNIPVEPGFQSIAFSRQLVPAAETLKLPKVPVGSFPTSAQDHQQYFVWIPAGAGSLELGINVQKVWANRRPKVSLYSPLEVTLNAVATDETYEPNGQANTIRLKTPHAGLHRVETVDGGDYTRIQWPEDVAVTIESGIDTPNVTSHFRGPWTLYFYVPKGTKLVGGWASRVANWAPRISGRMLDADGKQQLDFSQTEDGWFKVAVPAGQDGKLWKFENCQGQRLLMTVPPYLARNSKELLLPHEVVETDQTK